MHKMSVVNNAKTHGARSRALTGGNGQRVVMDSVTVALHHRTTCKHKADEAHPPAPSPPPSPSTWMQAGDTTPPRSPSPPLSAGPKQAQSPPLSAALEHAQSPPPPLLAGLKQVGKTDPTESLEVQTQYREGWILIQQYLLNNASADTVFNYLKTLGPSASKEKMEDIFSAIISCEDEESLQNIAESIEVNLQHLGKFLLFQMK